MRRQRASAAIGVAVSEDLCRREMGSGTLLPLPTTDFRTDAGNQWNNDFQIIAYPSGMIDRKEFNGQQVLASSEWVTDIASVINQSPEMVMIMIITMILLQGL